MPGASIYDNFTSKFNNICENVNEYISEYASKYVSEYTSEYISECTSDCTSDYLTIGAAASGRRTHKGGSRALARCPLVGAAARGRRTYFSVAAVWAVSFFTDVLTDVFAGRIH